MSIRFLRLTSFVVLFRNCSNSFHLTTAASPQHQLIQVRHSVIFIAWSHCKHGLREDQRLKPVFQSVEWPYQPFHLSSSSLLKTLDIEDQARTHINYITLRHWAPQAHSFGRKGKLPELKLPPFSTDLNKCE